MLGKFGKLTTFFKKGNNLVILIFFALTCLLAIIFRMKSIEQDYLLSEKRKEIKKVSELNKALRADRAKTLSTKNLSRIAKNHNMKEPSQKQIILVP